MSAGAVPTLRVAGPPAAALDGAALRAIPSDALARYLMERRWYGGKGRAPREVRVAEVIPVPWEGCPIAVAILAVEQPGAQVVRYQLPLALEAGAGDGDALATVESDDGSTRLVDATGLACARESLGRAIATGGAYAGDGARWVAEPLAGAAVLGAAELGGAPLPTRSSGAEQSNTSILYGDRAILKLYRRLEPGENPDVEVTRFLTTRTTFRNTPALYGVLWLERSGERSVAGMLTQLVRGAEDAWALALASAEAYLRAAESEPRNPFAGHARQLGETTRALHDALASAPHDPAFAPVPATTEDVTAWATHARTLVREGTALLGELAGRRGRLPANSVGAAEALVRRAPALLERIDELARAVSGDAGMRLRHHGDYHLGQVLRAGDGTFHIIDFEGEPARPLVERRALHSPLRDVAGMLRSFAYAAASGAMAVGGVGVSAELERRSARWERAAREGFLAGYGADRARAPYLPRTPEGTARLISLFELEKVAYELMYELNNRPDWSWIPMRGLGRTLGSA